MLAKTIHTSEFRDALRLSLPTVLAYFPLGVVFGIIFVHVGFEWWLAPLMSATVYAGAVQFVALSMIIDHAYISAILFACFFVALRNSFYGLSVLKRFETHWLLRAFLIFGLVDANYAIFTYTPPKEGHNDIKFCFYLTLIIYLSWVSGTLIGAIFAPWLPDFSGMAFILPCFFLVLVIEFYFTTKAIASIILPLISAGIAYYITPDYFLLIAILLSIISIFLFQGKINGNSRIN